MTTDWHHANRSSHPENIAWDAKSGAFFVGSMYRAKIVRISADGSVTDFIGVSDDASMAWILSRTRVRRVHEGKEEGFVYAGMMTYEKRDGRWVRTANASTFEE